MRLIRVCVFFWIGITGFAYSGGLQDPTDYEQNMQLIKLSRDRLTTEIEKLEKKIVSLPSGNPSWMINSYQLMIGRKSELLGRVRIALEKGENSKSLLSEGVFIDIYDLLRHLKLLESNESEASPANSWLGGVVMGKSRSITTSIGRRFPDDGYSILPGAEDLFGSSLPMSQHLEAIEKILGGFQWQCGPDGLPTKAQIARLRHQESATRFFDSKRFPSHVKFLKACGVSQASLAKLPREVDLSSKFSKPTWQGDTYSCTANVIVDQIEFQTGHRFSVDRAYATMVASEILEVPVEKLPTDWREQMLSQVGSGDERPSGIVAEYFAHTGIGDQALSSFLKSGTLVEGEDAAKGPIFDASSKLNAHRTKLNGANYLHFDKDDSVNIELLKAVLAAGRAPILSIDTDARIQKEDWIELRPGMIKHVVSLVGYGEDLDPSTGKKRTYFLIRDSLSKDPVHLKIEAHELVAHSLGMIQLARVKK